MAAIPLLTVRILSIHPDGAIISPNRFRPKLNPKTPTIQVQPITSRPPVARPNVIIMTPANVPARIPSPRNGAEFSTLSIDNPIALNSAPNSSFQKADRNARITHSMNDADTTIRLVSKRPIALPIPDEIPPATSALMRGSTPFHDNRESSTITYLLDTNATPCESWTPVKPSRLSTPEAAAAGANKNRLTPIRCVIHTA
ncbi:hypothetical protein C1Y40_00612 [Mycobacterium talmoniae]|uniref:Uncharacterized protein n=1 Tax=Mycobacterium talmoniae TaxID=1858794 RepID=A0A2S8BR51_9MYCO|nr:hypothetical protein C1Y40_00612 [Mycobacterium talmoniae]